VATCFGGKKKHLFHNSGLQLFRINCELKLQNGSFVNFRCLL